MRTGRPISELQAQWDAGPREPYVAVGLRRDPADLRRRIDLRVDRMVAAGLVEEVRALAAPGRLGPTAGELIGVKELLPALRADETTGAPEASALRDAVAAVKQHTWILARRQGTWWKGFPGIAWIDVPPDEPSSETGRRVAEAFAERAPA